MFDLLSHFIFPVHSVPLAGPLPKGAERLPVTAPDGVELQGIIQPAIGQDASKTLLLGFGGNAWNAQDVAEYLHDLYPDHPVAAFYYRGYRPSGGHPSAEALIADAPLAFDAATAHAHAHRVVAVGFSIGTGVAAQLSSQRRLDGLILVTPFDSLRAVAQAMVPWAPIGPFFGQDINAAAPLGNARLPVAIIAAEHDEIVPAARTDALRAHAASVVLDRTIAGAGHNSIYARSEFHQAMHQALQAVGD